MDTGVTRRQVVARRLSPDIGVSRRIFFNCFEIPLCTGTTFELIRQWGTRFSLAFTWFSVPQACWMRPKQNPDESIAR